MKDIRLGRCAGDKVGWLTFSSPLAFTLGFCATRAQDLLFLRPAPLLQLFVIPSRSHTRP